MPKMPLENKLPITIATCMPRQDYDIDSKLEWMDQAVAETECDLFLLPQEFL